ncbi:MAG TPA: hypothetical protein PK400_12850 [Phycisphaerales bacterium]|nr:hypothetical protein [Phycisphaerales bacterium]HRQ75866.1 hypothetical protein [Phycisphaerales bacterium]
MQRYQAALAATCVLGFAGFASGAIVPFTEHFSSSASNWYNQAGSEPASWVAGGGAPGGEGGYITATFNFANSVPSSPHLFFRGQANLGSSNGAFVGDWLSAGVTQLRFMVRHNGTQPLAFFARMTGPTNNPSVNAVTSELIAPGAWTAVTFQIVQDNPEFTYSQGSQTFFSIFGNLANIQIGAVAGALAGVDETFTFDLDMVSIVPTPASAFVLLGVFAARRRRR